MLMKTPSRPRIGITPDLNDLDAPETEYVVRRNYADALLRHGGLPLILPYVDDVTPYLETIDGLLVTGGMFDIDPALYGQGASLSCVTKPLRTAFEKALIEGALGLGIPLLGICNGMQLLAVCLGGQLVQDIPSQVPGALEHKPDQPAFRAQHEITIACQPRCLRAVAPGRYWVNSVHHQAVQPSTAYRPIAVACDGVIEAIEAVDHGFAVGVQWHPEYAAGEADAPIWRSFIDAATEFCLTRSPVLHG
ncbi:gamma-glutamyl-gamma-aminobutyrate hydrolase family protein [Rhizobium sp. BR 314]|uniref:gamma-glutamyl-gamma-aminobutyrate hydrolase family protein n=1 Tax=Rhizobium sp. BR 314 TaxID=3040013 RepID=UPI0039BF7F7F